MRKTVNGLMQFVFLASAVVQYNDPDPLLWVVVYLGAWLACCLWHMGRLGRKASAGVCLLAVLASVLVDWSAPADAQFLMAMGDWQMSEAGSELLRESGGLAVIGLWMAVLCAWTD